ncbi:membrane protein [Streptomyces viridochromogenes]|uniref:Membrane protein n=1 Tax=Streptomyces viridochromogenes TaxID=1938 RepID=A0A0J7YT49_STRVR|nr:DUF2637 domain-containing protein [Streptomyces viridochromogenes]KMS66679.1 membrane protein [Streptomyces viridochromogenes]KOG25144.1 membrane protein [Streptomyces viridochromogenes]KOG25877.1 membrane protein [Streptomyces viridochromogenes]
MRLTDISLNWLLPGAVLLLGLLAAIAVLRRGKTVGKDASADDSWERSEERRRRKEAIYGTVSYVLLFCCAAVAAALSFHGLVGFGEQNLGLTNGWQYLVPFGLDGAAMFCSVLAVREASHGDAALGSRILVWTFAFAAAWFNWVHAPRGIGHDGAPHFFAGMSLSAAVLFDRALKQTRRAALREQGLVPRPLPQIRIVRWLRAPRETYKAWSLMLLEGVRSLDEAVDEVREDKRQKEETRLRRRDQQRMERAQLKAISRGHRGFVGRGGRQVETQALERASAQVTAEPAISTAEQLPVRSRPSLQPVRTGSDPVSVDLTAEDDTMALPRLDSLERKLKDLEQQFG